jgi:hypothetical protein
MELHFQHTQAFMAWYLIKSSEVYLLLTTNVITLNKETKQ